MMYTTLMSATALREALQTSAPVSVFDCGFDLVKPEAGRSAYLAQHIPGAQYLHLDEDLSAAKNGRNGRHPLPTREAFAQRMRARGLNDHTQVVAYDTAGGMFAVRLWWMLRWIGHEAVAVLDGGWPAWQAAGGGTEAGTPSGPGAVPGTLTLRPSLVRTVAREDLMHNLHSAEHLVIDARSPDRFRGENETLDPVGGRIPGAVNRFFKDNLDPEGRFKPAVQLRAEFEALGSGRDAHRWVASCGSGVTACHNLLAMAVAGLEGAALYPGSWSEWSAWPDAPVATGAP